MLNLTKMEVRSAFQEAVDADEMFSKVDPSLLIREFSGVPRQTIYSWMALKDLIEELKKETEDPWDKKMDRLERYSIRFVVKHNKEIWFSLEGSTNAIRPTHSDMIENASVITAGNLVFSKDYTTIEEISNKSGHYLPKFGSLVFFISFLFTIENNPQFPVKIADMIKLVNYQKESEFCPEPQAEINLRKTDLSRLLPDNFRFTASKANYPYKKLRNDQGLVSIPNTTHSFSGRIIRVVDASRDPNPGGKKRKNNCLESISKMLANFYSCLHFEEGSANEEEKLPTP